MATSTLRPDGVAVNTSGAWTTFGSPSPNTLDQGTKDNVSTTGAQVGSFPPTGVTLELTMGTVALPALSQVRSVTPRLQASVTSGTFNQTFRLRAGGTLAPGNSYSPTVTPTAYSGAALTTRPSDGGAWTQADIDSLQFCHHSSNLDSGFYQVEEAYIDVVYNEVPVVSAITPSGTITTTAQPTIGWTYTDPDGDAQERFKVKVYAGTGTVADPDNTASLVDSGEVFSAGTYALPLALPAGSYRVYVKAADVGSNGRYSVWATQTFTIQIDTAAQPVIDAQADSVLARIGVFVQGHDNELTINQANLEVDASGWNVNAGCTIARSTAQFLNGAASLVLTATTTPATMSARTADTSSGPSIESSAVPVTAGRVYTGSANFKTAATARNVSLTLSWFTGASGSPLSTVTGLVFVDTTAGWTQAFVSGAAPAGALYGMLTVTVAAATGTLATSEVHYVDQIYLGPVPVRNLLSYNQGGFELDSAGWVNAANAALARSTAFALDGAASLALTPLVNGTNLTANHVSVATSGAPVVAGQSYTVVGFWRPSGITRTVSLNFLWYTAAGAFISTSLGATQTEAAAPAWTTTVATATAPATAAFVVVQASIATPSEVHYLDRVRLFATSINQLTPNQASLETDTSGWSALVNATIARSTAQFLDGAASLAITSVAAGTAQAATPTPRIPVLPNTSYFFGAWYRAATTGRSCLTQVSWFDSGGSQISNVNAGSGVTNNTTGWIFAGGSLTSPANAVTAQLIVMAISTGAAAEVHYVDSIVAVRTDDLAWVAGDRTTAATVVIEKSIDGGTTWTAVRGASGVATYWDSAGNQQFTVWDYEVARNVSVLYRARVLSTVPYSAASPNAQIAAAVFHAATGWWLKDPLSPGLNMQMDVQPGFAFRQKEPQTVYEPLGRNVSVVVTDGVKGIEGSLTLWTKDPTRYAKLRSVIGNGRSLWLEDVFGRAWYAKVSAAAEWSLLRAQALVTETTPIRHIHSVVVPFVEVGSPTGDTVTAGTPTP